MDRRDPFAISSVIAFQTALAFRKAVITSFVSLLQFLDRAEDIAKIPKVCRGTVSPGWHGIGRL